mmetsp:Transcript_9143/g.18365  ORF Transcript_9143/g.18365 Transcript_9143/m.18365 type:complete len:142 (+) Transcript_9143:2083-2508(+)
MTCLGEVGYLIGVNLGCAEGEGEVGFGLILMEVDIVVVWIGWLVVSSLSFSGGGGMCKWRNEARGGGTSSAAADLMPIGWWRGAVYFFGIWAHCSYTLSSIVYSGSIDCSKMTMMKMMLLLVNQLHSVSSPSYIFVCSSSK